MGLMQNAIVIWLKKIHDRMEEQNVLLARIAGNQDRQYSLDWEQRHTHV